MFFFHPYFLGKIPILTSIFFKGVGSTTNQICVRILIDSSKLMKDPLTLTSDESATDIHRLAGSKTVGFGISFFCHKMCPQLVQCLKCCALGNSNDVSNDVLGGFKCHFFVLAC